MHVQAARFSFRTPHPPQLPCHLQGLAVSATSVALNLLALAMSATSVTLNLLGLAMSATSVAPNLQISTALPLPEERLARMPPPRKYKPVFLNGSEGSSRIANFHLLA